MPKATRSLPAAAANHKKKKNKEGEGKHCFIVWAMYERVVEEGSDEKHTNYLCFDLETNDCMISRESALANCYITAATHDPRVKRGSMVITGILPCTAKQRNIWNQSAGILQTMGLDTATHSKVEMNVTDGVPAVAVVPVKQEEAGGGGGSEKK